MRTRLSACLAVALLLPGCGEREGAKMETAVAPVRAPVAAAEPDADADEAGIVAFHARLLATEVGLDAEGEGRVAAVLERAWSAARADVQGRVDAALPVDEEVVSELLLARQREADAEIAAALTPAQRARFEELGGRLGLDDDEPRVIVDGGAR